MKKKKILQSLLILGLIFAQSGCQTPFLGRTEIKGIEFIRVVGIDKATDAEGGVKLTIATQRVQAAGGGGAQKRESEILHSEGKTVFEAVRNFWNYMDRRPFWGHLEYILIGEEAARDGLLKYIDFFSRDPELRLNLKVFQVREKSAEEAIKEANSSDKFVFEKLDGVIDNQWGQSFFNVVELMEVIYILDKEYLTLYLPCIELQQLTEYPQDEEAAMDIVTGGFALFEGDELEGYLDKDMGRGLNWLKNKIKSGVIEVKNLKGTDVSLEIVGSKVKIEPKLVGGALSIHVKVEMTSNIAGLRSNEDIFNEEEIEYLRSQQEQYVRDEIESTIDYAQEKGIDFFGVSDAVLRKYPIQWEDHYQKKWNEIFPDIPFVITFKSKINRTYDIIQPSRKEASGDK